MPSKVVRMSQGSTFLWTEGYGAAQAQGRRRDLVEDVFFAVLVTAFLATSLGMVVQASPMIPVIASGMAPLPF